MTSEPLDDLEGLLTSTRSSTAAPFLPKAFVDEQFAFYGTTLTGTPQQRERWKRARRRDDDALGEAVGKLYVDEVLPGAREGARRRRWSKNIIAAFGARIDALTWMSPETKAKAKAKLAALKVGVGYPDTWRDYCGLEVVRGDALGNAERAELFEYERNLAKLGKPVDRDEWVMTPQLVNAVNLPAMNALNFPAAILQPPYFDPDAPAAMDYGAIGAMIGHEISHSFDDQGALFDADRASCENWWTQGGLRALPEPRRRARRRSTTRTSRSRTCAVNGKLTLAENIADVAGPVGRVRRVPVSQRRKSAPASTASRGDQQFFLCVRADVARASARARAAPARSCTDGTRRASTARDTVRNLDAWYPAFDVKPGQTLYLAPEERVHVW